MNNRSMFPTWSDIEAGQYIRPIYAFRQRKDEKLWVKTTKSEVLYTYNDAKYRTYARIYIKYKRDSIRTPFKIITKVFEQSELEFDYSEEGYNDCIAYIKWELMHGIQVFEELLNESVSLSMVLS